MKPHAEVLGRRAGRADKNSRLIFIASITALLIASPLPAAIVTWHMGSGADSSTTIADGGTDDVFENITLTGGLSGGARLIVGGGGTTAFHGSFIHNGAEVRVDGNGTIVFLGDVKGAGPITGNGTLALEGSYNPGNSPAVVSISANFTYNPSSLQIMEIFGLLPGPGHPGPEDGHDKILFSGAANPQVIWDGTLRIDLGNGFHPLAGMTFDLFDFDNTRDAGAFTTIVLNDPGGLLAAGLAFDYSQLYVDGTVSIIAVPEPASALLLVLGGLSLALRRRARASFSPKKSRPRIP